MNNKKAIAKLFPLFYLPPCTDECISQYMYTQQNRERMERKCRHRGGDKDRFSAKVERTDRHVFKQERIGGPPPPPPPPPQPIQKKIYSFIGLISGKEFKTINEEMEERQKIIAYFTASKSRKYEMKDTGHRITLAEIDELLSDIMTMTVVSKQEGMTTCFGRIYFHLGLCIAYSQYYKRTVVVVDEKRRTFLRFNGSIDGEEPPVFLTFDSKRNHLRSCQRPYTMDELKRGFYEMWDYKRPLRAISHFKWSELQEIAQRMKISEEKWAKKNKQELYRIIENFCYGVLNGGDGGE